MNRLLWARFPSILWLLLELSSFCIRVSGDGMRVPYVPYVVVDKHKDEFDYDRLQDEILGYLNRRHSEASTTLYDFLRTSISPATATQPTPAADVRGMTVPSSSSSFYAVNYPSYPAYPASIYKSVRKENPLVTAKVRVTTYQPHKYSTPLDNLPAHGYTRNDFSTRGQPHNQLSFVPVKDNGFTPIVGTTTDSSLYTTTAIDPKTATKFPYGSEMKCSLRSSRYVYDGECVSRKPVVETVCADRCIRYEYKRNKKPYFSEDSKTNSLISGETKKQVVALSCSDGDVKKQKVKLHCKDGTIINNIIRIVQNCVCNEHSEKVHATKRTQKSPRDIRTKMAFSMPQSRIRSRPKF